MWSTPKPQLQWRKTPKKPRLMNFSYLNHRNLDACAFTHSVMKIQKNSEEIEEICPSRKSRVCAFRVSYAWWAHSHSVIAQANDLRKKNGCFVQNLGWLVQRFFSSRESLADSRSSSRGKSVFSKVILVIAFLSLGSVSSHSRMKLTSTNLAQAFEWMTRPDSVILLRWFLRVVWW